MLNIIKSYIHFDNTTFMDGEKNSNEEKIRLKDFYNLLEEKLKKK